MTSQAVTNMSHIYHISQSYDYISQKNIEDSETMISYYISTAYSTYVL